MGIPHNTAIWFLFLLILQVAGLHVSQLVLTFNL